MSRRVGQDKKECTWTHFNIFCPHWLHRIIVKFNEILFLQVHYFVHAAAGGCHIGTAGLYVWIHKVVNIQEQNCGPHVSALYKISSYYTLKSNERDIDDGLTACFPFSRYQLIPCFILQMSVSGSVPPHSPFTYLLSLIPQWYYSSPFPSLTLHLLCMVIEAVLGGLALLLWFVIRGLTCWREELCSEMSEHLLFQVTTYFFPSRSLFFGWTTSVFPGILLTHFAALRSLSCCCVLKDFGGKKYHSLIKDVTMRRAE